MYSVVYKKPFEETLLARETEKEKEDGVRLRAGRTCERHIEAEILIRVGAVKF